MTSFNLFYIKGRVLLMDQGGCTEGGATTPFQ